jgi:hypothetical protein
MIVSLERVLCMSHRMSSNSPMLEATSIDCETSSGGREGLLSEGEGLLSEGEGLLSGGEGLLSEGEGLLSEGEGLSFSFVVGSEGLSTKGGLFRTFSSIGAASFIGDSLKSKSAVS